MQEENPNFSKRVLKQDKLQVINFSNITNFFLD